MQIPLYQVDAFSERVFGGNPAAVCPLPEWLDGATLQAIAEENNLAETAFLIPHVNGYEIRWFTPTVEVDLCGHATLAAGYVVMNYLDRGTTRVRFESPRSGELSVTRDGELYALDFPSRQPHRVEPPSGLLEALGGSPTEVWKARDYMVVYETEDDVVGLRPDMRKLGALEMFAAMATAPGSEVDFVSRFFAPAQGIPEDPVTGSAYCTLVPYWSQRLGLKTMRARQLSKRRGELYLEDRGQRVEIAGKASLYATGTIYL